MRGDELVGPYAVHGGYRITANDTGAGRFIVTVLDAAGQRVDVPITAADDYSGSVTESGAAPGDYYLQVNSRGVWSLTIASV